MFLLSHLRAHLHDATKSRRVKRFEAQASRLVQFKDAFKDQACFLFGNGPSLNHVNLDEFKGITSLCSNKIHLIYDKTEWRPTFVFMVDPFVIEQSLDIIKSESKVRPYIIDYFNSNHVLQSENIYYYRSHFRISFNGFDPLESLCNGTSVTYVALQFAYYMGFKHVFLFGVDHSYAHNKKPFDVQVMESDGTNHFHPSYFPKNSKWWVPDLDYLEMSLRLGKFYYERDGRKIYDCTINGNLNVFDKMDYREAIQTYFKKR